MSCGTCGVQASTTMQEDTGVPAGASATARPRCPHCHAFISTTGTACRNPRCPALRQATAKQQVISAATLWATASTGWPVPDPTAATRSGPRRVVGRQRYPHMPARHCSWVLPSEDGNPMGYNQWERAASFAAAIANFQREAPSRQHEDYDYVQVVPKTSLARWLVGNDGAQGWRHRATGWTIPDFCRQTGGTPEMWNRAAANEAVAVPLAEDSPIWRYVLNNAAE